MNTFIVKHVDEGFKRYHTEAPSAFEAGVQVLLERYPGFPLSNINDLSDLKRVGFIVEQLTVDTRTD